ncbi:MAG: hypothetical protein COU69_00605, partial [Candidatus Pacebacteria bacterium CG10_big_fil_rev_8_21_14_0_10_56_10]
MTSPPPTTEGDQGMTKKETRPGPNLINPAEDQLPLPPQNQPLAEKSPGKLKRRVALNGAVILSLLGVAAGPVAARNGEDSSSPNRDTPTTLEYSPLEQQEGQLRFAQVRSSANVRTNPDSNLNNIIATLTAGRTVQITGTRSGNFVGGSNLWYHLRFSDSQGQVQTGFGWSGLFNLLEQPQPGDDSEFSVSSTLLEHFTRRLGTNDAQPAVTLSLGNFHGLLAQLAPLADNQTDAELIMSLQQAANQAQPEDRTIADTQQFPVIVTLTVERETGAMAVEFSDPMTGTLRSGGEEEPDDPDQSTQPATGTPLDIATLSQDENFDEINNLPLSPPADNDGSSPAEEPVQVPAEVTELLTEQGLADALRLAGTQQPNFIVTADRQLWLTVPFDGDNPRYEWQPAQNRWIDHHPGRSQQDNLLRRTDFFNVFGDILVWNLEYQRYQRTTDGLLYFVNTGRRERSEVADQNNFEKGWGEVIPNPISSTEFGRNSTEVMLVDETEEYNIAYNPAHPQRFREVFSSYFDSQGIDRLFVHLTDQQQDVRHSWGAGSELIVYSGH